MWQLIILSFAGFVHSQEGTSFVDHCHETHSLGLDTLIRTAVALAEEEAAKIREKYVKAIHHARTTASQMGESGVLGQSDTDSTWNPSCPTPDPLMFTTTTAPITTRPTTVAGTAGSGATTGGTTIGGTTVGGATAGGTTASGTTVGGTTVGGVTAGGTTAGGTTVGGTTVGGTTAGGVTAGGTTASGTATTAASVDSASSTTNGPPPEDKPQFKAVPLYMNHHSDPLASHMTLLHKYVSKPEHACNNQFTDLNSITEHQLYGFLATLVTTDVGPFCSICHRMVTEIRKRAFAVSAVLGSEDEQVLSKLLYSHVPSTKSICSAIAPACYDNYEENVANVSQSLLCAECPACMIVTNILQHRLLLKKEAVASLYDFLKQSLFHNICAELCNALAGQHFGDLWPHGFTYNGCQDWFKGVYDGTIRFITTITRPERFCSLELGWCELNEVPNMLQCLPEFCRDFLGGNPIIKLLCNLLPGDQEEAAKFLNVAHSKRYKEKKPYHDKITTDHDEL